LRLIEERDVAQVKLLLNRYLSNFEFAPNFEEEDVRHWFLNRPGVVWAYVVEV